MTVKVMMMTSILRKNELKTLTMGRGGKGGQRLMRSVPPDLDETQDCHLEHFEQHAAENISRLKTSDFRAANLPLILPPLPLLAPITPPCLSAVAPGRDS